MFRASSAAETCQVCAAQAGAAEAAAWGGRLIQKQGCKACGRWRLVSLEWVWWELGTRAWYCARHEKGEPSSFSTTSKPLGRLAALSLNVEDFGATLQGRQLLGY